MNAHADPMPDPPPCPSCDADHVHVSGNRIYCEECRLVETLPRVGSRERLAPVA